MNKIKYLLMSAFLSISMLSGLAQTTSVSPELKTQIIGFAQQAYTNRDIAVAVYPSYAPNIVIDGKKDTLGLGIAVLCPASSISSLSDNTFAQHAFGGLRFDLLGGQFFASTVVFGVKGDFQIYKHDITIFGESGANIPITGAGNNNINLGAMVGTGLETEVLKFGKANVDGTKNGSLIVFGSVEEWTQFDSQVYHLGAAVNWTF